MVAIVFEDTYSNPFASVLGSEILFVLSVGPLDPFCIHEIALHALRVIFSPLTVAYGPFTNSSTFITVPFWTLHFIIEIAVRCFFSENKMLRYWYFTLCTSLESLASGMNSYESARWISHERAFHSVLPLYVNAVKSIIFALCTFRGVMQPTNR